MLSQGTTPFHAKDPGSRRLPIAVILSLMIHLLGAVAWEIKVICGSPPPLSQRAERPVPVHLVKRGEDSLSGPTPEDPQELQAPSPPPKVSPAPPPSTPDVEVPPEPPEVPLAPPVTPPSLSPPEVSRNPLPMSRAPKEEPFRPSRPGPNTPPPRPELAPAFALRPPPPMEPRLTQSLDVSDLLALPPPAPSPKKEGGEKRTRRKATVKLPSLSEVAGAERIPPPAPPGPESQPGVLAMYAYGDITGEDLTHFIGNRYGIDLAGSTISLQAKTQLAKGFLNKMVLSRMAVHKAEELGLADRPEVQQDLNYLIEENRIAELVASIQGEEIAVSQEEITQYYQEHQEDLGDWDLGSIQDFIAALIRSGKAQEVFDQYIAELREAASVQTHFERLTDPQATEDLALFAINGQVYTLGEWRTWLSALPPELQQALRDPEKARRRAEDLLLRRLLLAAARDLPEGAPRERIQALRERMLRALLYQERVARKISVSDSDIATYYERVKQHWQTLPQVKVSYVRFPTGDTAAEQEETRVTLDQIRQVLMGQPDFTAAVQEQAAIQAELESGRLESGRWMDLDSLGLMGILPAPPQGLKVGHLTPPILFKQTLRSPDQETVQFFWYVFRFDACEEARTPSLKEIGPFLREDLWGAQRRQLTDELNQELWEDSQLQVYPDQIQALFDSPERESPPTARWGQGEGPEEWPEKGSDPGRAPDAS